MFTAFFYLRKWGVRMATEIDSLQIEINASATKANDAIDKLVKKLDILSDSLSKINSSGLSGLASGVDRLGTAMQSMKNIRSNEFTRLANNIERLSKVDVSSLNNTANTISNLTNAFSGIGAISNNSQQLGILSTNLSTLARGIRSFGNINSSNLSSIATTLTPLANGITVLGNVNFNNRNLQNLINSLTRLSNANVSGLSNINFSQLGNSISQLATSLQNAPNIHQSIISMTNAISNLSESGQNISIVSANLGSLGNSLRRFMSDMALAPSISDNTISFSQAIGTLANVGDRVGTTATNLPALGNALRNLMVTLSTAPNVSQNVIDLTNALAKLASQGGRVGSASNRISRGLNRASTSATRAKKSFGGLASKIGKFYATYFMLIRGLKDIWKSIESTSDYLEAYNYFDVALGKIGKDWGHQFEEYGYENAEEYAESFSKRLSENLKSLSGVNLEIDIEGKGLLSETGLKNLGLNIQEVTQYASQLASVTNSVGQTGEVSLAAASTFTKLGADMSSLFNVDYSSVMNNLQSGLIGQSRALYKYGIDITNATLQTYAYELGLSKAVSEMTQAEKMQLRMIAILDQSKVAWGDLANTINSPSNMIRQFTNNIKEARMILGQLFIPLLQKVLPIINGVMIAIKRLLVSIAEFFGIKIDLGSFGQGYSDLSDDIGGVSDSLDNVASSAKKAKAGLRAFDELKTINMPDTSSSNSGIPGGSGIDLTDEILNATSEYEKAWQEAYDRMEDVAGQWADKFEKIFAPVKKLFKDISIGDWFAVGQDVNTIATGILDFFINAIEKVDWKEVGNNIGEFIQGLDWLEIIKKAFELKFKIWEAIAEVWFGSFKAAPIETAVLTAIGLLKFTGASKIIASKLFGGLTPQAVGSSLGSKIFSSLSSTWTSLGGLGGILTTDLATIIGAGTAAEIGVTLATGVFAAFAAAWGGFEVGKLIGDSVTSDEFDDYYKNFKFFGDGGFFDEISDDWGITMQASLDMSDDLGGGPLTSFLKSLDKYGEETDLATNKIVEFGMYSVQMGSIWQDSILKGVKTTGKAVDKGMAEIALKTNSGLSEVGSIMKRKSDSMNSDWEVSTKLLSKTMEVALATTNSNAKIEMNNLTNTMSAGIAAMNSEIESGTTSMISRISASAVSMGTTLASQVGTIKSTMNETKNSMESMWSVTTDSISKGITASTRALLAKTTGGFNGIIEGFEGMIRSISLGTNSLIAGVNASLGRFTSSPVKSFNPLLNIGRLTVPSFETGGYVPKSYSMFMAGENGIPEIMGTVGGKSAVAGGVEITGIKDAIYSTSQQEVQLMREQNSLLRALLEKETGISEDAIFRSVKKSASDYTKRTGRPAF